MLVASAWPQLAGNALYHKPPALVLPCQLRTSPVNKSPPFTPHTGHETTGASVLPQPRPSGSLALFGLSFLSSFPSH